MGANQSSRKSSKSACNGRKSSSLRKPNQNHQNNNNNNNFIKLEAQQQIQLMNRSNQPLEQSYYVSGASKSFTSNNNNYVTMQEQQQQQKYHHHQLERDNNHWLAHQSRSSTSANINSTPDQLQSRSLNQQQAHLSPLKLSRAFRSKTGNVLSNSSTLVAMPMEHQQHQHQARAANNEEDMENFYLFGAHSTASRAKLHNKRATAQHQLEPAELQLDCNNLCYVEPSNHQVSSSTGIISNGSQTIQLARRNKWPSGGQQTISSSQSNFAGSLKRIKSSPRTAQQASLEAMRTIDMYLIRQIARSCMVS